MDILVDVDFVCGEQFRDLFGILVFHCLEECCEGKMSQAFFPRTFSSKIKAVSKNVKIYLLKYCLVFFSFSLKGRLK